MVTQFCIIILIVYLILYVFNKNHGNCIAHLNTLRDIDLEKDNFLNIKFGNSKSFKTIIIHHIRHVGAHNGHLSSLCKLNGIKTF